MASMMSSKVTKFVAAGAAAVAVAAGGIAIGNSSSSNRASGAAAAAQPAGQASGSGDVLTAVSGKVPQNWSPGTGTIITGADADKAKVAALAAKQPGTVNRVLKLSDGSYVVHLFATSGPHHIFVSQDFRVTGVA
jgi:ABC-type transport system substrate-binding protein